MCRYNSVLLKRVSQGGICYSKNRMAFVSRRVMSFKAEEYSDVQGECVFIQCVIKRLHVHGVHPCLSANVLDNTQQSLSLII